MCTDFNFPAYSAIKPVNALQECMYCLCMFLSFACCDILQRRMGDNSAHIAQASINNMKPALLDHHDFPELDYQDFTDDRDGDLAKHVDEVRGEERDEDPGCPFEKKGSASAYMKSSHSC